MPNLLLTSGAIAVVLGVLTWRRQRWLVKHARDSKPSAPIIAAVSPGTGELIPSGVEEVSDHGIGDGTPPAAPMVP